MAVKLHRRHPVALVLASLALLVGLVTVLALPSAQAAAKATGSAAGKRVAVGAGRSLGRCHARAKRQMTTRQRRREIRRVSRCRTAKKSNVPPTSLYWGSWIGKQFTGEEAPWDMGAVSQFEAAMGKGMSTIHFAAPFADCSKSPCSYYDFPADPMDNIRGHGSIPFFSWSSQATPSSVSEPDFQLADVIGGTYDSYIRRWATEARDWGGPFFLRFNWEMNGNWFPWAEGANGNQPGEYVTAWRHVHDIFASVGANNATWVWCPNVDPSGKFQDLAGLYPGDEYVDWTCLDGYNWGTNPVKPSGWISFDKLFSSTYHEIVDTIAPTKPMIIGEVGSTEVGGSKAEWMADMLSRLPTEYQQIRGVLAFDKYEESMDWPLDTSASATAAFAAGVQSSSYVSNQYGSLGPGKIQPPS